MDPFDLNWRHLRAIQLIASHGSLSLAAKAAYTSQPALTKGLAKLERQLETPLFARTSDGMKPTKAGGMLVARVDRASEQLASAAYDVTRRRGVPRAEQFMTAIQLRAAMAVADAGGFAAARLETGHSEPALHRAVRELERIVGTPLVERRGRGVRVTPAGHRLARGIRLAGKEIAAGIAEIRENPAEAGPLLIGAMPLARARVLPLAVAALMRESPASEISIFEGSWRELVEPLLDGRLDMMIGALREEVTPDLSQQLLFKDNLVVVAGAGHPLADTKAGLNDLARYPWVVGAAGTPLRAKWNALFRGTSLPAAPIVCGSTVAIRTILANSDLLTLLSPDQVAVEVAAGMLTIIDAPLEQDVREIGIVTRNGWIPTKDQQRLLTLLGEASNATLPEK